MRNKKGQFMKGMKPSQKRLEELKEELKGNKRAIKLKTPELKKEAYRQYCDHIATGNSKDSFVFEHPDLNLTSQTMEKYLKENPTEFNPIHKQKAEAKSFKVWEKRGEEMMLGKVKGCQPAIYQMFMRNKFGWDKQQEVSHTFEPEARKLLEKWEKMDE